MSEQGCCSNTSEDCCSEPAPKVSCCSEPTAAMTEDCCSESAAIQGVKEYYGKTLQSTSDLASGACCATSAPPVEIRDILPLIADEILERFYGCGSPLPPLLDGLTVLDLGCGTGRDVYIASKLVGQSGHVIGVDMTPEQIAVAQKYQDEQRQRFGFAGSNVSFLQGYIEDLGSLEIADNSIDVIISNCVINLSPDKKRVFAEAFRVLKPGGELYFSDVFADRRISDALYADPVLRGECLSGALYVEDFRRLMAAAGWPDFRYTSVRNITLDNAEIAEKVGFASFSSRTVRAFKLADLEDICEDYGQVAYYDGSIPGHPHYFDLDDHHRFYTGKPMLVCGNTASMLVNTRFSQAFVVVGDRSMHFGAFAGCGGRGSASDTDDADSANSAGSAEAAGGCCC